MDTKELLTRSVEEIIQKKELEKALKEKKKLRIYIGVDPSGPEIHLGHAVILRKLREFQKLGFKVIFLIGDFTGMIGDPTDRTTERQPLTRGQVLKNAETYKEQVSKIISFKGKNPAELRFNSEWHSKMNFEQVIGLSAHFTVQRMLERDMFEKRIKEDKPIGLHEFIYPLIQGYDAVALDADVQVGGTDQKFNMLASRKLVKILKGKTQTVVTFTLLEGTDGRKMSKSFNNIIGITEEPKDIFGKVMSLKDNLIIKYFVLTTDVPMLQIKKIENGFKKGANPRDAKLKLAFEIVKIYHGEKEAKKARKEFEKVFSKREIPKEIPCYEVSKKPVKLVELLSGLKMASSKSEARRLIEQGAVDIDETTIFDKEEELTPHKDMIIKVGKRKWAKIV